MAEYPRPRVPNSLRRSDIALVSILSASIGVSAGMGANYVHERRVIELFRRMNHVQREMAFVIEKLCEEHEREASRAEASHAAASQD